METSRIGRTNLQVSRIGFGACAAGGYDYGQVRDDESIDAVRLAIDRGINFFDTADVYGFGHSEEVLSAGLGAHRSKMVIATKFGVAWDATGHTYRDTSPRRVREALQASLRRLRLDCIPLYQVHWHDGVTPLEDTLGELERCREEGKILHYGCSNISFAQIERVVSGYHLASVQLPYSLSELEHAELVNDLICRHGIGVIVYNVLARGLLTGKYNETTVFNGNDTRQRDRNFQGERMKQLLELVGTIRKVGTKYNRSPGQVAIRWVMDNPKVSSALVGVKRVSQLEDNLGALDWILEKEDYEILSQYASRVVASAA